MCIFVFLKRWCTARWIELWNEYKEGVGVSSLVLRQNNQYYQPKKEERKRRKDKYKVRKREEVEWKREREWGERKEKWRARVKENEKWKLNSSVWKAKTIKEARKYEISNENMDRSKKRWLKLMEKRNKRTSSRNKKERNNGKIIIYCALFGLARGQNKGALSENRIHLQLSTRLAC